MSEPTSFDELYNSVQKASFVEEVSDGFIFSLVGYGDDAPQLVVDASEFNAERTVPEGEVEVLVERPWGGTYWSASVLKAEKLAMYSGGLLRISSVLKQVAYFFIFVNRFSI